VRLVRDSNAIGRVAVDWRRARQQQQQHHDTITIDSCCALVEYVLLFHVPSTTTSSSCCCCCCCSTLLCFHRRTLPAPRKSTRSLGGSVDYLVVSFFTILFCFVALNPLLSLSRSLALSAVVSFGHLENFTLFFTDTLPLVSFVSG
jgi:hypothetical protein